MMNSFMIDTVSKLDLWLIPYFLSLNKLRSSARLTTFFGQQIFKSKLLSTSYKLITPNLDILLLPFDFSIITTVFQPSCQRLLENISAVCNGYKMFSQVISVIGMFIIIGIAIGNKIALTWPKCSPKGNSDIFHFYFIVSLFYSINRDSIFDDVCSHSGILLRFKHNMLLNMRRV